MAQADAHACLLDALNLQKVVVIGGSMARRPRCSFVFGILIAAQR